MGKNRDADAIPAEKAAIIERLAEGESLSSICRSADMPSWVTVHDWLGKDTEFAEQVRQAREEGYQKRAVEAVETAKNAKDAGLGRLAFDAERWYLGKLSNAFSDNKAQKHEVEHDLSDKAKAWLGLS